MILGRSEGVVHVELIALAEALAQRQLHRVVFGARNRALDAERVVLRREERELAQLAAGRIAELIGPEQRRNVVGRVRVERAGHHLCRGHPVHGRAGEHVLPVGLARDAGVRRQRRVAVDALRRANQLPDGREVVETRPRVFEVGRHCRVAPHQQVAATTADVGRFEGEPLAQLAAHDHVERVVVGRHDGAVQRRRDDVGILRRRLREPSRRRSGQRRRDPVDALEPD